MTRARTSVKSSAKSQKLTGKWASTEPYRDGLTYRQWMQRNGKAQRARELAVLRAARGERDASQTDPVPSPAAAKAAEQSSDEAPPVRTERGQTEGRQDAGAGGAPDDRAAATSDPAPEAPSSKPRRRAWGRRGWKTAKT